MRFCPSEHSCKRWVLWQRRKRYIDRTGPGHLGFLRDERHSDSREIESSVSRGDIQPSQPRKFQPANAVVFTPSGVSPTAGAITSTSTTSRQVQFGLKLLCDGVVLLKFRRRVISSRETAWGSRSKLLFTAVSHSRWIGPAHQEKVTHSLSLRKKSPSQSRASHARRKTIFLAFPKRLVFR